VSPDPALRSTEEGKQEACAICSGTHLVELAEFRRLPRVTSDAKPFPAGGRLAFCETCGGLQKPADARWRQEASEIYAGYEMFHQSAGLDQKVRDPVTGMMMGRSELLAERLARRSRPGSILDIGCGTGVFLRACDRVFPESALYGFDLDRRAEPILRRLKRFRRMFHGDLGQLHGSFDLVALIHSLEHMSRPLAELRRIRDLIAPHGILFIQVPDGEMSPLDLVVADHLCHFGSETLSRLLARAGYRLETGPSQWLGKELARPMPSMPVGTEISAGLDTGRRDRYERRIAWLREFGRRCAEVGRQHPFGIFGSSIAAVWLAGQLDGEVDFFVDEDEDRIGRTVMGRPIVSVDHVPKGAQVYVGLLPAVATQVAARLSTLECNLVLPPELTQG